MLEATLLRVNNLTHWRSLCQVSPHCTNRCLNKRTSSNCNNWKISLCITLA